MGGASLDLVDRSLGLPGASYGISLSCGAPPALRG